MQTEIIFEQIKTFLLKYFENVLKEYDDGTHIVIGDSGIWISLDQNELTVGYGMNHQHFNSEYEIQQAVDLFFNLLTRKKRITQFFKGKYAFKNRVEVEVNAGVYMVLGRSSSWLYPFWKKNAKRS